jgi:hypothetical protein
MSALEALFAARNAGAVLIVDGDDLILRAKTPLPEDVLALLRAAKPDLVRILRRRETLTENGLAEAIAAYFAAYREWRGPPDILFARIGHPLDEDDAILFDLLRMIEEALAERGIAMEISRGYVVLTRPAPDLIETIVAYMVDKVEVSALPEGMLTVMKQPPIADEAAMISRFKEIEDALAGRGIALRYETASGYVVLEHCRSRSAPALQRPNGVSEKEWAKARARRAHFIDDGWSAKAVELGWTADELYQVPPVWARVDLCGAALLIDEVIAVTAEAIVIRSSQSGSVLKYYRIGRGRVA